MITKEAKRETLSTLTGETRDFTIRASGKAFRTLIDGLYSRKIEAAVREICSNAFDAHVAAGIADTPFWVKLPNMLDPNFLVRDYGHSMDHDFVMASYSTLFHSDKENTNAQVGLYGLGSKSPFAYTDSFNVITYRDGVRRAYLCHINSDDIPTIVHQGEEETDEPDGTEVNFAVIGKDINLFSQAVVRMMMGYEVMPKITGETIVKPDPVFDQLGIQVYPMPKNFPGDDRYFLNQGSVLYPWPADPALNSLKEILTWSREHGPLGDYTAHSLMILKVPIGTFDITPSRESLDLNEESCTALLKYSIELSEKIAKFIDSQYAGVTNRIQSVKKYLQISGPFQSEKVTRSHESGIVENKVQTPLNNDRVHLWPDHIRVAAPALWSNTKNRRDIALRSQALGATSSDTASGMIPGVLWRATGKHYQGVSVIWAEHLDKLRISVGLEREIPRRVLRMREACYNQYTYFIFSEDLPRIMRILDLRADQILSICELPDVEVKRATRVPSVGTTTKIDQVTDWDWWCTVSRGSMEPSSNVFGNGSWDSWHGFCLRFFETYDKIFGTNRVQEFKDLKVLYAPPSAMAKVDPGPDKHLSVWFDQNIDLPKVLDVHVEHWKLTNRNWINATDQWIAAKFPAQRWTDHYNLMVKAAHWIVRREFSSEPKPSGTKVENIGAFSSIYVPMSKELADAIAKKQKAMVDEVAAVLDSHAIMNTKNTDEYYTLIFGA